MDDLEAYAAGYLASLHVRTDQGAPLGSATVSLNVFVLADAPAIMCWAADTLERLIDDGPEAAGFSGTETSTGTIYEQLVRPTIPPDPEGLLTFTSLTDLRKVLVEAGLPLTVWVQDDEALPGAAESGRCSDSSVLLTFKTADAQLEAVANYRAASLGKLQLGEPVPPLLVGPNWVLLAPEAPAVADRLNIAAYVHDAGQSGPAS